MFDNNDFKCFLTLTFSQLGQIKFPSTKLNFADKGDLGDLVFANKGLSDLDLAEKGLGDLELGDLDLATEPVSSPWTGCS